MVDNNENIYVQFDCNNITLVDPNKVIDSEGKVKERNIRQENLVMYANLQCKVLPRTKLLAGADGETSAETITVAEINFLNPGNKTFMSNSYIDELTGKDTLQGKGVNQKFKQDGKRQVATKGETDNIVDNGFLGITNITINQGLDFLPVISMELVDIKGRAMFELGNNSPYAAFFNLPYPMFELTIKGYYGKAVKLKLMLQNFSSRYSDIEGNFNISLKFYTYKYTVLTEVTMGALLATPHMYKSRLKITKTSGNPSGESKVNDNIVEIGYQKIKEMYNEYKSKGIISKDFPEITIIQLRDRIENFVKNILESFVKDNLNPLNDADTYLSNLNEYYKSIYSGFPSWKSENLDDKYYIVLKDKTIAYTYKKEIAENEQSKKNAEGKLIEYVDKSTTLLSGNNTFGNGGKKNIPNPITLNVINGKQISYSEIDFKETYTQIKKKVTNDDNELKLFENELKNNNLLNFTDITLANGSVLPKTSYFVFTGPNSFESYINKMEKDLKVKREEIETELTNKLNSLLQSKDNGIGFTPTIRNVLAVFFASGEAYLRLMDDVHTKAWDSRNTVERKNAILTKTSSTAGQDNTTSGVNNETPIYPWPQYIVETDATDGHEKYEIAYPGDPKYISATKGYRYDVWPEIQFVEEFIKGLSERMSPPDNPTDGNNSATEPFRMSYNAIEFPIGNDVFENKEEIKFFYEIYERMLLHSNYSLFSRVINTPLNMDSVIYLFSDSEAINLVKSLSDDNPFLIKKLKEYGYNSANFVPYLKSISNGGVGLNWQNYIRGIFNTSYIKNKTTANSFEFISSDVVNSSVTQPMVNSDKENDMITYLENNNDDYRLVDLYPFTNLKWSKNTLANGVTISSNTDVFKTKNMITYNKDKKIITNFLNTDTIYQKKPFTNYLTKNVTQPLITKLNLVEFYENRKYQDEFVTEGELRYFNYTNNVYDSQTVSMLNTPYFINSIQKGVENFRNNDDTPYTQGAYLFLNSLPISTLKEKYLTFNETDVTAKTELDYIASTLKKFGAIHKLPYAFILKYGSIWHRYKEFINNGVDILTNVWQDFDYVKNYDPITQSKTKNYFLKIGNTNLDIILEKNTTVGTDTSTLINAGFYPKLINDFNVFLQGYEIIQGYTSTEINNAFLSGLTMNYVPDAIINLKDGFDPNSPGRDLRVIPWTLNVNSLDNVNTFVLPSQGSFINQTELECLNDAGKLTTEILNNPSVYNGSIRLFWAAPTYGYFDNSKVDKPSPSQYFKYIFTGTSNQENYSIQGDNTYSDISELLTVFDYDTLNQFEEEFLLFSKSKYDYTPSKLNGDISIGNFQSLIIEMLKMPKTTGNTTNELVNNIQVAQLKSISNIIDKFLNKEVYVKYGNPSNFDRKLFYTFSQHAITDKYTWNPYTVNSPNALPTNGGTTLQQSKNNYPNEWKALQLYVGFSEINGLKYTDSGSYITDFFIDNNIQFTVDNIKKFAPIIKIYATQKLNNNNYNALSLINDMEKYLNDNDAFLDKVLDNMMTKVRKDLPSVNDSPISKISTELQGPQTKVELWESFKALNDKWIAGGDFKYKTLFEDVLLIDRASRDIGDKVLVDIYKLKTSLYDINTKASMYSYIDGLIRENNFTIMNLPSYVNFYNVQEVSKNPTPKPDGSLEFANNLFGTFLNVDTRQSSPKLVCIYANKASEQLAVDTNLTKRNDDAFELDCGSPIIENQTNKKDWGMSNKVAAFNVDVGIQNQSLFYRLQLDQNNSLSTAESLQVITDMANQAGNRKGSTQNVSLYNLYKIRSYTVSFSMMGNAMIQPSMYFNLRYVPMFSGPYMITNVSHVIGPGSFETNISGVRQPTASLPKVDEYIQTLKTNLLSTIIQKNKENVGKKTQETKDANKNVLSEKDKVESNVNGGKTLSTDCTAKAPYNTFYQISTPLKTLESFKNVKTRILEVFNNYDITDDGKLKYVIFASMYIESGNGSGFECYENNFAGIDLSSNWGDSIKNQITQQFYCLTSDKTVLPYAQFRSLGDLIKFLGLRWERRMGGVTVDGPSIAKFWIENLSANRTNSNVYETFDKTVLNNLEEKVKKSIDTFNAI